MRSLAVLAALAGCRGKPAPSPPAIAIELAYPGATPEMIEASAVIPLERAVTRIGGVRQIESRIEADHATVLVEFDRDLDAAMPEVQHAISGAELPAQVSAPLLHRTRRDDTPILWLALRATAQPVTVLSAFAREEVRDRLVRVPGVAEIEEHGLAAPTLVVWPDLDKVASYGLPMFDVVAAVQAMDIGSPEALGEVIVKAPVRLRDVARIELGFERPPGEPMLAVRARIDADRDKVLRAVRAELAQLEAPAGITVEETRREVPPPAALVATLHGDSLDELRAIADDYVKRLAAAGVRDVVVDPAAGQPEQTVVPDRDRAAQLGISMADVHATLRVIGAQRIGEATLDGLRRPVVIKLPAMPLAEVVDKLHVRSAQGQLVPLSSLISVQVGVSQPILRIGQWRAIRFSIRGSVDAAKRAIRERALPKGYKVTM